MEGARKEQEPASLKVTIKLKKNKTVNNSLGTAHDPNNLERKANASNSSNLRSGPMTNSQDQVDLTSEAGLANQTREDDENPSSENSHLQMVLYDANANRAHKSGNVQDPVDQLMPSFTRKHPFSDRTPRVLPSVGAFTVQCANCFKWRLVPTKEKYEEIREHIMEQPFFCEIGQEWRPEMSCEDPPDIVQDDSRLWAIDKPSIAQPPPGWQRLLRIRGEGGTKFADVYYVAPSGKRLRSIAEIERYLELHKEYKEGIASMSQFSFQTPRPLQENYVRKRTARVSPTRDAGHHGTPGSLNPCEVHPIAWIGSDANADLQPSGQKPPPSSSELRESNPGNQSAKKRKPQTEVEW